ncbi:hypothetical protein A0J61_05571 [Choanephora cucurbitarum]|uniref:Uncharacterized protein n=1 Tax=Choanephora cucurbitarum TaxID=101091 RepID=A0A1C7NB72_9FUNG|nr:hypothetical protein A0J61_05571 [Choanephora cucurbitarum]
MVKDFVSALVSSTSLGRSQNDLYDNLVALVQQAPYIASVTFDCEYKKILLEAIRNTCDADHKKRLQVKLVSSEYISYELYSEETPASQMSLEDINVEFLSDKQLTVGLTDCFSLNIENLFRRMEVDEVDRIVHQYPQSIALKLSVFRLTDWNKVLNETEFYLNVTQLTVYSILPTNVLLQYIYSKFLNVQHFELIEPYKFIQTDNFMPLETITRFAYYLDNMNEFKIALYRLTSSIDVESYFRSVITPTSTSIQSSNGGLELTFLRPKPT